MQVPCFDLIRQIAAIGGELKHAAGQVIERAAFAGGPFVARFEEEFAATTGVRHCVGVNSGTSALHGALVACGIGPGDEVITVPFSFIATAEAISHAQAHPVFIDIEEAYGTMSMERLAEFLERRTLFDPGRKTLLDRETRRPVKAIVPVHLFGQPAAIAQICSYAVKYGLAVVEDCAQSHLAEHRGKPVGTFGDIGCFSFYPSKNLGACGEAGAIITDNAELDLKIRMLRDHGQKHRDHHEVIGYNYRMDGLQGAMLSVKLKHLKVWTEQRRHHAALYRRLLDGLPGILLPAERENSVHVYNRFVIRVPDRARFIDHLAGRGVGTAVYYPQPIHLTPAYRGLGYKAGDFPVSEQYAREAVALPMFPELEPAEVEFVAGVVREYCVAGGR